MYSLAPTFQNSKIECARFLGVDIIHGGGRGGGGGGGVEFENFDDFYDFSK